MSLGEMSGRLIASKQNARLEKISGRLGSAECVGLRRGDAGRLGRDDRGCDIRFRRGFTQ